MEKHIWILQGDLIFTAGPEAFTSLPQGFLICSGGHVLTACQKLPAAYQDIPVQHMGHRLILPGFVDLHTHAPQFNQIGLGMDDTLLDWLNSYTFPEERHFQDDAYAERIYSTFVDTLAHCGTTRSAIFATIHKNACRILYQLLQRKGLGAFLGKVCMDRNAPAWLCEDTETSIQDTRELLQEWQDNPLVRPIITPRFAPTSTPRQLQALGELALSCHLPVQSHLSENKKELSWVAELFPEQKNYGRVYEAFHLFGDTPTLMAHCIYLTEDEQQLMAEKKIFAVHCPDSNLNLTSGLMPARKLLRAGVPLGLGSDIGAGHTLFMPQAIVRAIQVSKMRALLAPEENPLSLSEAFYLATKGGGSFFGKVGSFEPDFAADLLILKENPLKAGLSLPERLAHFIYSGSPDDIQACYTAGHRIE